MFPLIGEIYQNLQQTINTNLPNHKESDKDRFGSKSRWAFFGLGPSNAQTEKHCDSALRLQSHMPLLRRITISMLIYERFPARPPTSVSGLTRK